MQFVTLLSITDLLTILAQIIEQIYHITQLTNVYINESFTVFY